MKNLKYILASILFVSTMAYGVNRFITAPSGDLILKSQSGIVKISDVIIDGSDIASTSNYAVGSIQQSILTETQFQAKMGLGWVKIKGQSIAGSKLCTEYSICTLPSAEGRYLRDSIADAGLGTTLEEDTKLNGITADITAANFEHSHSDNFAVANYGDGGVNTIAVGSSSHLHSAGSSMVARITYSTSSSKFYLDRTAGITSWGSELAIGTVASAAGGGPYTSGAAVQGTTTGPSNTSTVISDIGHGHSLSGSVGADNVTTDTPVTFSNDGTETRPTSLVVNTFIKIN